jgi:hypothetical protein
VRPTPALHGLETILWMLLRPGLTKVHKHIVTQLMLTKAGDVPHKPGEL